MSVKHSYSQINFKGGLTMPKITFEDGRILTGEEFDFNEVDKVDKLLSETDELLEEDPQTDTQTVKGRVTLDEEDEE